MQQRVWAVAPLARSPVDTNGIRRSCARLPKRGRARSNMVSARRTSSLNPFLPVNDAGRYQGELEMTADTTRTFATMIAALFCSTLLVTSATSLPLPF